MRDLLCEGVKYIVPQPSQAEFLERLVREWADGWKVGDEAIWTPEEFGPYRMVLTKRRESVWMAEFADSSQAFWNVKESEMTPVP